MSVTPPGPLDESDTAVLDTPPADVSPARPSLETFMHTMKARVPNASDRELHQYWAQHYSDLDPRTLPTWTDFQQKVTTAHPDTPDEALRTYWDEHYGDFGAGEKTPGFVESAVSGMGQGMRGLKESAIGTFERLQSPESPWHKDAAKAADAIQEEITKHATPGELKGQTWYDIISHPGEFGNFLGNTLVQSAPSLVGAVVGGVVGGIAAPGVGALPGAAAGITAISYFQQAGSSYREAFERYKKNGLDEATAHDKAYYASGIAGLVSGIVNSWAVPASVVAPFNSIVKNLALQYVSNVLVDAGDQVTGNLVKAGSYAPETAVTEDLGKAVVGSMALSAPETMTTVKAISGGPANVAIPQTSLEPLPDPTIHPDTIPAAIGVSDPSVSVDDAITIAAKILKEPVTPGSAVGPTLNLSPVAPNALNQLIERGGTLPNQTDLLESIRTKRPDETPILPGAEPTGPMAPVMQPTQAWQAEAVTPIQPAITPGRAFTPRAEPEPDYRANLEAERAKLQTMRKTAQKPAEATPLQPLETPAQAEQPTPLRTALSKAYPSVEDIHALADAKGLAWDNSPVFMEMTKMVTGKMHLDELTPQQRQKMVDRLHKIQPTVIQMPVPTTPKNVVPSLGQGPAPATFIGIQQGGTKDLELYNLTEDLPGHPKDSTVSRETLEEAGYTVPKRSGNPELAPHDLATERLSTFDAAQVPRGTLVPEQNAEMLARAEKAQADLEIAGNERGTRVFTETQGQGSTQEVTGLKLATADWYKSATTGPQKLSRQRVDKAVAKIIEDKGRDVGQDVQRIKELLLQDQEFNNSPFAPKTDADWKALIETATGRAAVPTPSPSALPSKIALQRAAPSVEDIHALAQSKGLDPESASFHATTEAITGTPRLDNLKAAERRTIAHHLDTALTPMQQEKKKLLTPRQERLASKTIVPQSPAYVALPAKTREKFESAWTGAEQGDRPSIRTLKEWLYIGNKTLRGEFERRSGVKLPKGLAATNAAVEEYFGKEKTVSNKTVTLYRAEPVTGSGPPKETISEWLKESPEYQGIVSASGRWFTNDRKAVEWYVNHLKADGYEPQIKTLKVTPAEAERYSVKNHPEALHYSRRPDEEFFVDPDRAKEATIETKPAAGEPFALKSETVKPPKPKAPEQQSIPVPPPLVAGKPIIGREAQPGEAPLFSKAAQIPEAEQTTLPAVRQQLAVTLGGKSYPVESLAEASAKFRQAIETAGTGSSETPSPLVIDHATGVPIGYISYNGRIWEGRPQEWTKQTKLLYDPRPQGTSEPAQTALPETKQEPTTILANALRSAANQIEGKPTEPSKAQPAPHVKAAIRETTEKNTDSGTALYEEAAPYTAKPYVDPFYSHVAKVIDQKMPNKANFDQLKGLLLNNGVKPDEMKWLGLDDYLRSKESFTKQEVQQFVRENSVQVKDVTKGTPEVNPLDSPVIRADVALLRAAGWSFEQNPEDPTVTAFMSPDGELVSAGEIADEYVKTGDASHDVSLAAQRIEDFWRSTGEKDLPKFSSYQLPGGTNYRELLLTLPQTESPTLAALRDELENLVAMPASEKTYKGEDRTAAYDRLHRKFVEVGGTSTRPKGFTSSHFSEPNILAHVRYNTRTDAAGKKVLFLEEVQSDWHQIGKREGYRGDEPSLPSVESLLERRGETITVTPQDELSIGPFMLTFSDGSVAGYASMADAESAVIRRWKEDHLPDQTHAVPDAPFKKTWHELALKRMLRYAAENGYDSLAWTTGAQQAERYDLSKQAKNVIVKQWGDNKKYGVSVTTPDGEQHFIGEKTLDELPGVVGKDLATKIAADLPPGIEAVKTYEGLDLKVGGEGMKGFYDTMLPAFLNKYGKKWGAQAGETQLESGGAGAFEHPGETVHSLPITDSMRQSVLTEGQALFENTKHYAVREGEQADLNYEIAQAALGDLDRAGTNVSTRTGAIDAAVTPGVRTVALGISPDLVHQGVVDLTGYTVSSAEDLAKLAQVYRDPRFETFRFIYVKGDQIVGHEGMTSRLPAVVQVFNSLKEEQDFIRQTPARMKAMGADGYWMLHNHPSGKSQPSIQDRQVTDKFFKELPGFQGHVVIDSNEYSLISVNAERITTKIYPLDLGPDALLMPSIPHPLLGSRIESVNDVLGIAKHLQSPDYVTVLYRSAQGNVQAIQEMTTAFFRDATRSGPYLAEQGVAFGSQHIFTHEIISEITQPDADGVQTLIEDGILADHVVEHAKTGRAVSARNLGIHPHPGMALGKRVARSSERVESPVVPYESGTINPVSARDRLTAAKTSARPYLLGALSLEQLSQVYGRDHREVADYNAALQTMQADFSQQTQVSDRILKDWDKLKIPVADQMAGVMEDARRAKFDPDPVQKQAVLTATHKDLQARFTALPENAKAIYRAARDFYTQMATDRFEAIKERIERSGATLENRKRMIDRMQVAYEKTKSTVYFPFTRFGDHLVKAVKMEHEKEVDRDSQAFESLQDANKFAMLMKAKGWKVKQTTAKAYSQDRDAGASSAVREMMDIIEEMPSDQLGIPGIVSNKRQLLEALDQTFLQALPDMSYAKHFIHAKEVKGASRDALRSFAHSALHGAHHISRIRHADKLSQAVMDLDKRINTTEEGDVTEARQVYNELVQRHNTILNPNTHPVAAWLGQLGFTMSLGGVVATGLTNATQVPLITFPWLAARYGAGRSALALGRAYNDFLDPKTLNTDSLFDASQSSRLSQSEREDLKELQRRGRIDLTQTMDLAGRASQDNLSRVAKQTGTLRGKMAKMLGFTFHAPEVMNRQVTAIATIRLAIARGATHAEAIDQADQAIKDTHFIYSQENRARYMSGNVLRVLTMFKQYSAGIAFLYGRAAHLWLAENNATPEERVIAKRQLLGMASLQFAAAGALGMPFVGTVASLLTAMMNAFGDDDDKKDWEVELRKMLAEQVGKDTGEVLSHGLSRLTPWDMAARLGQSDLFFRAPSREREGRAGAMDWATSFAGPVLGYAVNAYLGVGDVVKGLKDADAGHFLRGVEELTPSIVKNGVKALRYEIEGGVRTRDQHKQLDVNYAEKLGQFFGFTPSRSAEMYESVNAIKNAEHRMTQRRNDLLDQYASAFQDHEPAAIRDALAEIRSFNEKHPYLRINGDTIMRSLKGRAQRERGTKDGVYLPRKREPIRQEGAFGNF